MVKTKTSPFFMMYLPVAILEEFNLSFAVSAMNKTDGNLLVYASFFIDGKMIGDAPALITSVPSGSFFSVTQQQILTNPKFTVEFSALASKMVIIHCVPQAWASPDMPAESLVEVPSAELLHFYGLADIFLEYRDVEGVPIMSVGAGGPPGWNRPGSINFASTIAQGAKCIVSRDIRTFLLLFNGASNFSYVRSAEMLIRLMESNGQEVNRQKVNVPAFDFRIVELAKKVEPADIPKFLNIVAANIGSTLFPFVLVQNTRTGGMFIEHGMPPHAYANHYGGQLKYQAAEQLML